MVGSMKKERGAVAIQVALIIPILVIIVIGAFEVWKVLYMQQVLNDAAYQGVRLLCMQPNELDIPLKTEKLVRRYVATAPFADPELRANPDGSLLRVTVSYYPPQCGRQVKVTVALKWTVGREWLGAAGEPSSEWFPFLSRQAWLTGDASGPILCEREQDVL